MKKLSVLMITYNHEQYIAQALDSVLDQQVDFDYEIVIGEDCSTDSTREILKNYKAKFPDRVVLLERGKNLGMIRNLVDTLQHCTGEYIALLEGDDYWTDVDKLQKQIAFLDAHNDVAFYCHNALVVYEDSDQESHPFHADREDAFYTVKDLFPNFIPTCSTVFRAGLFSDIPEWFYSMPMADWPLHVMNARFGKFFYSREIMATYRIHSGGVWSGKQQMSILANSIASAEILNKYLDYRYNEHITKLLMSWDSDIARILLENGNPDEAIKYYHRSFWRKPGKRVARYIKNIARAYILIMMNKLVGQHSK